MGTPLALSDEQGQVVAEWVRDPFGKLISKTGTVEDNHMFPGQFWDADANLAYNWNRWYAPEVGRYTQYVPQTDTADRYLSAAKDTTLLVFALSLIRCTI